jgi:hypothetical protein
MKIAAAALVDLQAVNKAQDLFKEEKSAEIKARRNKMMEKNPGTSMIGAYQASLKELWDKEDKSFWENRVLSSAQDIHE